MRVGRRRFAVGAAPRGECAQAPGAEAKRFAPEKDADTRAMEKAIADALGLHASLNHKGEGGQLIITYKSFDQLDNVFRRLTLPT